MKITLSEYNKVISILARGIAKRQVLLDLKNGRLTDHLAGEYKIAAKSAINLDIANPGNVPTDGRARRYQYDAPCEMMAATFTPQESLMVISTLARQIEAGERINHSIIPATWRIAAYRACQEVTRKMGGTAGNVPWTFDAIQDLFSIPDNVSGYAASLRGSFESRLNKAQVRAICKQRLRHIDLHTLQGGQDKLADGYYKPRRARQLRAWVFRAYKYWLHEIEGKRYAFKQVFAPSAKRENPSNFARTEARLFRDLGLGLTPKQAQELNCKMKTETTSRLGKLKHC